MEEQETYTISDYLTGAVRGVTPTEAAIRSVCSSAGIDSVDAEFSSLTLRQQRLSLAFLYVWVASGPSTFEKWSEKDGDWSQSGGGGEYTAEQLRRLLRLADEIFEEYDLPTVGASRWKVRYGGFRNIRSRRGHRL